MATSFHLFPKLPQELRDAIWRDCLPRRVVEIDFPSEEAALELGIDNNDENGRVIHREVSCQMESTSQINAQPPIISRVCRESRSVALETGAFIEHPVDPKEPSLHRIRKHWVDRARDTAVHLHFNNHSHCWYRQWKEEHGNPLQLLRDAMLPANGIRSISNRLLTSAKRRESWEMIDSMAKIMVCLKVVIIHADEEPAVQLGVFGRLGEERIVMVDPFDVNRIQKFRDFWRRYQRYEDELTESFFDDCIASDPIQCRRATLKATEDIKTRWVIKRWFEATGPWERQQDASGRRRWVQQIETPGLVQQEVWEKTPVSNDRDVNIRCWVPNQKHPWSFHAE